MLFSVVCFLALFLMLMCSHESWWVFMCQVDVSPSKINTRQRFMLADATLIKILPQPPVYAFQICVIKVFTSDILIRDYIRKVSFSVFCLSSYEKTMG